MKEIRNTILNAIKRNKIVRFLFINLLIYVALLIYTLYTGFKIDIIYKDAIPYELNQFFDLILFTLSSAAKVSFLFWLPFLLVYLCVCFSTRLYFNQKHTSSKIRFMLILFITYAAIWFAFVQFFTYKEGAFAVIIAVLVKLFFNILPIGYLISFIYHFMQHYNVLSKSNT